MNVLINGASGKMGNELFSVIKENEEFEVVCGVDKNEDLNGEFPIYSKIEDIKEKAIEEYLKNKDGGEDGKN